MPGSGTILAGIATGRLSQIEALAGRVIAGIAMVIDAPGLFG
jgi:hypothetical protein